MAFELIRMKLPMMNRPWSAATLILCLAFGLSAAEPSVRVVTSGWNTPTVQQFARDAKNFAQLPFDGCAIHARADSRPSNPLSNAHTAGSWAKISFGSAEQALDGLDPKTTRHSYLIIKANPGDADWLDDHAWFDVVEHWRVAARLARRGNLRGLLFDPEPYTEPFEQFNYNVQAGALDHSFEEYAEAARRRGRQVMQAVADEFPTTEIFAYFLTSYFVHDHAFRGPSPVTEDGRREDFSWCLAGHKYGLLPSFLSGWIEASPPGLRFVDGCEYGYWLTEPNDFARLSRDVRKRGRFVVDADVRERYDQQISVAFPVFVDIIHPELIAQWAIEPDVKDRMSILRRQIRAGISAGDGMVWLYGERGRWWPPARETALWKGKDTYLHWIDLLPGCIETIREVRGEAKPRSLTWVPDEKPADTVVGESPRLEGWQGWTRPETSGQVTVETDGSNVKISGAADAAGMGFAAATPGQRFRVRARVRQTGRGITLLRVRFRDADDQWITGRGIDAFAYPNPVDPSQWRKIQVDATVPAGAAKLVVLPSVRGQWTNDDEVEFTGIRIQTLNVGEK